MQTNEEPKTQKRFGKRMMIVAAVTAVAATLFVMQSGFISRPSAKVEASAKSEAIVEPAGAVVLAAPGRVEGQSEVVEVGAGADGVLTELLVSEGQQVAAGQPLARIACADIEAERESARATVEAARQTRARLLRGSRDEERSIAAGEITAAEAKLKQAQQHYERMTSLYETGDMPRATYEQALRDRDVAASTLRAARDRQSLINAAALPEDLARAEAEIRVAEGRVNAFAARLDKCIVRAPMAGRVLRVNLKPGETVSTIAPRPVVSLADTSRLRVRVEVDERDLGRIQLGQTATVAVDAFPGRQFAARVSQLGALMGRKQVRTGDPAEKSDRDVLEVLVDLDERDERLVVGLRTTVRFLAQ